MGAVVMMMREVGAAFLNEIVAPKVLCLYGCAPLLIFSLPSPPTSFLTAANFCTSSKVWAKRGDIFFYKLAVLETWRGK